MKYLLAAWLMPLFLAADLVLGVLILPAIIMDLASPGAYPLTLVLLRELKLG